MPKNIILKKSIKLLPLLILVVLAMLLITGNAQFGFGMGDLIYHGLIYLGLLIYGIFYIAKREIPPKISLTISISFLFFCAYLILTMTIWRGGEIPWNN